MEPWNISGGKADELFPEQATAGASPLARSRKVYFELAKSFQALCVELKADGATVDGNAIKTLVDQLTACLRDDDRMLLGLANSPYPYLAGEAGGRVYAPIVIHGLNVAIYSLKLLLDLQAPENRLPYLGVAALFSRVDLLGAPDEKLAAAGGGREDFLKLHQYGGKDEDFLRRVKIDNFRMETIATLTEMIHYQHQFLGESTTLDAVNQYTMVIHICDEFEKVASGKSEGDASPAAGAMRVLRDQMKDYFSQDAIKFFFDKISFYPIGSFVKLSSRETAKIVDVNDKHIMRPLAMIVLDAEGREKKPPVLVNLKDKPNLYIRKVVSDIELCRRFADLFPESPAGSGGEVIKNTAAPGEAAAAGRGRSPEALLAGLVTLGEGFTIEFKTDIAEIGRGICAFANATGGVILIGVDERGVRLGVPDHDLLTTEISSIAASIKPAVGIEAESLGQVLKINVPPQHAKPYSLAGKYFLRDGASTIEMAAADIGEYFAKEGAVHFDETPCAKFDLGADLTPEVWERFAARANIPPSLDAIRALENLHLLENGGMTHAGAWLLAVDITRYTPAARVTCALFQGVGTTKILDRKDFTGDLYSIYESVIAYVMSKLNTEFIITAAGREEVLELPEEAIREAVVNAIAHRDYRAAANVQVHIFQDRLEIVSPGALPAGMSKDMLGERSVPRNPLLFGAFYRMRLVERLGSGIHRIRERCRQTGRPEPKIEADENWFTVIFPRLDQSRG